MSFSGDLERFTATFKTRSQAAFVGIVAEAKTSIQFGSPLTGAPGQVVADNRGGELRASWQLVFETPTVALISTSVPWAQQNEDGIARPGGGIYRQLSAVGGRWSRALTIASFDKIVDAVTKRLGDGA